MVGATEGPEEGVDDGVKDGTTDAVGTIDGESLPRPLTSPYVASHNSQILLHSSGSTTPPSLGEADGSIEVVGAIDGEADGVDDGVDDGTAEIVGTIDKSAVLSKSSHQLIQKSLLPAGDSTGTSVGEDEGELEEASASS
jgi:hypothetical protein